MELRIEENLGMRPGLQVESRDVSLLSEKCDRTSSSNHGLGARRNRQRIEYSPISVENLAVAVQSEDRSSIKSTSYVCGLQDIIHAMRRQFSAKKFLH